MEMGAGVKGDRVDAKSKGYAKRCQGHSWSPHSCPPLQSPTGRSLLSFSSPAPSPTQV